MYPCRSILSKKKKKVYTLSALGLLSIKQTWSGTQKTLSSHQPHPSHVLVCSDQSHHRYLGELREGTCQRKLDRTAQMSAKEQPCSFCPFLLSLELFRGAVLSAADDLSRAAAEVENHWDQTSRTLQSAWWVCLLMRWLGEVCCMPVRLQHS